MINFSRIVRGISPIVALALAGGIAGCDGANISIDGDNGKKLTELDLNGAAPAALTLLGPDEVKILEGPNLDISVKGEAAERIRFVLNDGSLAVLREKDSKGSGTAVVIVTMPAPRELILAGAGRISSESLARDADVTIAGSGKIEAPAIDVDKLDVSIVGSGTFSAGGVAKSMELNIAGSGDAKMAGLKVDAADINIAGSGDAEFASDGTVETNFMGSGNVTVSGTATCTMNGFGSGKLNCQAGTVENSDGSE